MNRIIAALAVFFFALAIAAPAFGDKKEEKPPRPYVTTPKVEQWDKEAVLSFATENAVKVAVKYEGERVAVTQDAYKTDRWEVRVPWTSKCYTWKVIAKSEKVRTKKRFNTCL